MVTTERRLIDRLLSTHQCGGRWALLFDYDGTLTPLVEHPQLARLDDSTRHLLQRLTRQPRLHLAIISSRAVDDLRTMVGIPGICLAGSCGLEMEVQGLRIVHPQADQASALAARIFTQLNAQIAAFPGAWVEQKRLSLTVHYRRIPSEQEGQILDWLAAALKPCQAEIRVESGPKAVEVTPNLDWNKATAIAHFMRQFGVEGEGVLYAGDSANDAEALQLVAHMAGIAIGIGPDAPLVAPYHLDAPGDLIDLLSNLLDSLAGEWDCGPRSTDEYRTTHGLNGRFFPMASF